MELMKVKLPEFFQVKLGNVEYQLETETLITSMSHQYLSQTSNQNSFDNYDILFSLIKEEINEYLIEQTSNKNNFIDLFGDWSEDFKLFHNKKNEPISKDLIFNFSDGSKWSIKILDLLTLRKDFNAEKINYNDPILNNFEAMNDWLSELDWENVSDLAEEIQRPQPEPDYKLEWKSCNKELISWENSINLLDFFEIDDTMEFEEDAIDKPI